MLTHHYNHVKNPRRNLINVMATYLLVRYGRRLESVGDTEGLEKLILNWRYTARTRTRFGCFSLDPGLYVSNKCRINDYYCTYYVVATLIIIIFGCYLYLPNEFKPCNP